jgi:hypothetical protein
VFNRGICPHYQSNGLQKNAIIGAQRRNSHTCPHVLEQRCAPIAQPESSDFESSRSSYPSQALPSNQINTQQRAYTKPEQKNGINKQNGTRG